MSRAPTSSDPDLIRRIKLLMLFRVLFCSLLLGSTIIVQLGDFHSLLARPLLILYGLIVGIFGVSFLYGVTLARVRNLQRFATVQIALDTVIVTLIIFVTGGFASIFGFLYLMVIIYASLLLYGKGSLVMAALCSLQYSLLIGCEHAGLLAPLLSSSDLTAADYVGTQVLYQSTMMVLACFAVAYLSHLLSAQTRVSRKELLDLEDRMRRVQKLADMGEMAAGLVHEIKNPLASIAGSIQLLRDDLQGNPYHDKLMTIVLRETDRLSSLVTSFLMFARPPAGKTEKIRLDRALEEIVHLFARDGTCKDRIAVDTELNPGLWIEMDPEHLKQVVWNLLLNAAESIDGAGRIKVSLQSVRQKQIEVRLADTGCGMTREQIDSIFDPFFTTKSNGTGLGLSIVHSLLEAYDCRLGVESEIGIGTAFVLRFRPVHPPG